MKRNTFNYIIDIISFLVFFLLILTGLLIYYVLPPCGNCTGETTGCEAAPELWGMGRHSFGAVHFYLSLATIGLMVVHVALHWSWVCQTTCRLLGLKSIPVDRQNLYGTIILALWVLAIIALLYLAKMQVQ